LFANGEDWRQRRTLILGVFRHVGLTKYEAPIALELEYLVECIKRVSQRAFNPLVVINGAIWNITGQLLTGTRMTGEVAKNFEPIITGLCLFALFPERSAHVECI
jgi:hypothetical protein